MTVAYYVGGPGTGKTTLACAHAMARAGERAVPAILLDSENVVGSDKWPDAVNVKSLDGLLVAVWRDGRHARYHTFGEEEVDRLCAAVREGGGVSFVIDECSYWANSRSCLPELARAVRVHRHSQVDYFFTSQYPADISTLVWNCRTDVFSFRNESARALDRLQEECALTDQEREIVRTLPNLRYIHRRSGAVP